MAKLYCTETETFLPRPREEVFAFFSDARNLEKITPPFLRFQIMTPLPIEMEAGRIIDYRLRLNGIPIKWKTEISHWEPPFRFVDTQLQGPYRRWVHEHRFESVDGGTRMTDRVEYRLPFGWLGSIAHALFVRRQVESIFAHRTAVIQNLLNPEMVLPSE